MAPAVSQGVAFSLAVTMSVTLCLNEQTAPLKEDDRRVKNHVRRSGLRSHPTHL